MRAGDVKVIGSAKSALIGKWYGELIGPRGKAAGRRRPGGEAADESRNGL